MLYEIQLNSPFYGEYDEAPDQNYAYSTNVFDYVDEPETAPVVRTYGVEIELVPYMNNRQNFVDGIHEVFAKSPTFIVKSDSTISPRGGEIVTVPLGLDAMPTLFGAIEAHAPRHYSTQSSCGVHIHAAVPNNIWALARMHALVMPTNALDFGSHVFGRQPGEYHMRGIYNTTATDAVAWARQRPRGNHRTALEFSSKGTLELRSFAGTIRASALTRYAEYYDALIEFCSTRVRDTSSENFSPLRAFTTFVLRSSRWPALADRLDLPGVRAMLEDNARTYPRYHQDMQKLFLPREARVLTPRQPRVAAPVMEPAVIAEMSALITRPPASRSYTLNFDAGINVLDHAASEGAPVGFISRVNERVEQSQHLTDLSRVIGYAGSYSAGIRESVTYAWLLHSLPIPANALIHFLGNTIDFEVFLPRATFYNLIERTFHGCFTSSRGTVYTGRRLYTLILNYHLPRALSLINGNGNTRPYGANYHMLLAPPFSAPRTRDEVAGPAPTTCEGVLTTEARARIASDLGAQGAQGVAQYFAHTYFAAEAQDQARDEVLAARDDVGTPVAVHGYGHERGGGSEHFLAREAIRARVASDIGAQNLRVQNRANEAHERSARNSPSDTAVHAYFADHLRTDTAPYIADTGIGTLEEVVATVRDGRPLPDWFATLADHMSPESYAAVEALPDNEIILQDVHDSIASGFALGIDNLSEFIARRLDDPS